MVKALNSEVRMYRNSFDERIDTIYFGGGTPSILKPKSIESILSEIRHSYNVSESPEITLETNPEDLSIKYLTQIREIGVNRLSIGIQSFHDPLLEFINRNHSEKQALDAYGNARTLGFNNINLDLIYALPTSTSEILSEDLTKLIDLNPEHISIYAYTIEPKTAFENWIRKGKTKAIDQDIEADQFETIMNTLGSNYEQYEISNFSKSGFYSRHNRSYWNLSPYLGIGPSAHSFHNNKRWANPVTNHQYIDKMLRGDKIAEFESRTNFDAINEYIFTSLRTQWGCDLKFIESIWQLESKASFLSKIAELKKNGLLNIDDDIVILTQKGKFLADKIASELFVEEDYLD